MPDAFQFEFRVRQIMVHASSRIGNRGVDGFCSKVPCSNGNVMVVFGHVICVDDKELVVRSFSGQA
jgi:hypothetical protein